MKSVIEARDVTAGYGQTAVVRGLDLTVAPGEVVALLGPNGAGKTTTLLTLAGALQPISGKIFWEGKPTNLPLHRGARRGLALVTEERSVFMRLSARQNLAIARDVDMDEVTRLFPELVPLMGRRAGLLSGGEQQMLTLGRALARPTHLLLADELSLGLAPTTVGRLLRAVRQAADAGMGVLVVEQHVHRVLKVADRAYVMSHGRIQFSGTAAEARKNINEIQGHYLTDGNETRT